MLQNVLQDSRPYKPTESPAVLFYISHMGYIFHGKQLTNPRLTRCLLRKNHSQEKVSTVAGLKSASQIRDLVPYPLGYTAGVDQVVLFRAIRICCIADSNYGVIVRSMVDKH